MKVILVSTFYKPSVGGVERQVEEIYLNLKKKGIDVEVYTTDACHSGSNRLLNYEVEPFVKRFKYLLGFGYFFRFSPGLVIDLLFNKYDVIHVHNIHDAHILPIMFINIFKRGKLIVTGHNPYIVDKSKRGNNLSKGVAFFDSIIKIFSFLINGYTALLESEKNFVSKYLSLSPNKIEVIPNGIREHYYNEVRTLNSNNIFYSKYNIDKNKYKLVLGVLCRIDFVKGIQNLKKAIEDNNDCLFVIAGGDGGYLNNIKELFNSYNNVFFTDEFLNVNESLDFYSFIDIFLLPSVYEPFGITIVEAMTQGKYILASSNGGPKEIIKSDYGEILDPNNHVLWSDRVKEIKLNREFYVNKGLLGIKDSYKYKWENVINKLISVYRAV